MFRIHSKQLSILRHNLKSRIWQSHLHSLSHRADGAVSTIYSAGGRERRGRVQATHLQSRAFASTDSLPRRLKNFFDISDFGGCIRVSICVPLIVMIPWGMWELHQDREKDRVCNRSLTFIEQRVQQDPDILTAEEISYVKRHAKTAGDTFAPHHRMSMEEYCDRLDAQKQILSIRDRLCSSSDTDRSIRMKRESDTGGNTRCCNLAWVTTSLLDVPHSLTGCSFPFGASASLHHDRLRSNVVLFL